MSIYYGYHIINGFKLNILSRANCSDKYRYYGMAKLHLMCKSIN